MSKKPTVKMLPVTFTGAGKVVDGITYHAASYQLGWRQGWHGGWKACSDDEGAGDLDEDMLSDETRKLINEKYKSGFEDGVRSVKDSVVKDENAAFERGRVHQCAIDADAYDRRLPLEVAEAMKRQGKPPHEFDFMGNALKGNHMEVAVEGTLRDVERAAAAEALKHHPVDHPSHYTQGGIECLDAIEAALSPEEFIGFLRGQIIKYTWRCRLKGGAEDVKKAGFYQRLLVAALEP